MVADAWRVVRWVRVDSICVDIVPELVGEWSARLAASGSRLRGILRLVGGEFGWVSGRRGSARPTSPRLSVGIQVLPWPPGA